MNSSAKTGFAIALAWPETYCKQPGSWYDPLTLLIGINKNNYYKVGHAALVLIDIKNRKSHYFDFGRYHAPYQHGRVRSAETDHDLEIKTIPVLSQDGQSLENFWDILYELQKNQACHGEGSLYASYCMVNFEKAYAKANQMQDASPIPYGPFKYKGSNCSRFVNTAILAGKPDLKYWFSLKYLIPFSPTPLSNVNSLDNRLILPKLLKNEAFCPVNKLENHILKSTLPQPDKHPSIPTGAKWLSGEGCGSWFVLKFEDNILLADRYSPSGILECSTRYKYEKPIDFNLSDQVQLLYPSTCKSIKLLVKTVEYQFINSSYIQ